MPPKKIIKDAEDNIALLKTEAEIIKNDAAAEFDKLNNLQFLDKININNFYTITYDNDKAIIEVSEKGIEHLRDEVWHDFHESISMNSIEKLFTKTKLIKKQNFDEYNNENEVLINSNLLGASCISYKGNTKYVWFSLSNLNIILDPTSDQDSFETFLPISTYEQLEKLFLINGYENINDPYYFVVDALKRKSCVSGIKDRIRNTSAGFYKVDTTPSNFSYLDAATTGDYLTFEDFAIDPEPEKQAKLLKTFYTPMQKLKEKINLTSPPLSTLPSPPLSTLPLQPLSTLQSPQSPQSPPSPPSPPSIKEETVSNIKQCEVVIPNFLKIEFKPIFDDVNYFGTEIIITEINNEKLYKFEIIDASVSNILEEIKNYLGIELEKGTRKTKQFLIDEAINKTKDLTILKIILGIILAKTFSDELQMVLPVRKIIYATFDGNAAVGVARTEANFKDSNINHSILFEKGIGVICLRPIKVSYLSCFLTNIDKFSISFKEILNESSVIATNKTIITNYLKFFADFQLSLQDYKSNIHTLLFEATESLRKHINMQKILNFKFDKLNVLIKNAGYNELNFVDFLKRLESKFNIPLTERFIGTDHSNSPNTINPNVTIPNLTNLTNLNKNDDKKRPRELDSIDSDSDVETKKPRDKSKEYEELLIKSIEYLFKNFLEDYNKNYKFLKLINNNYINSVIQNNNLKIKNFREIFISDEFKNNMDIFLKYIILIIKSYEGDDIYLDYDDNDVANIICLFSSDFEIESYNKNINTYFKSDELRQIFDVKLGGKKIFIKRKLTKKKIYNPQII